MGGIPMSIEEEIPIPVISDYFKRTPILLVRVSTTKQSESLKQQEEYLVRKVKEIGFKPKPEIVSKQESGEKEERATVKAVLKILIENPRKKFIVVVRDVPRFSRDSKNALIAIEDELWTRDVPLYIADNGLLLVNDTATSDQYMVYQILLALASLGKRNETKASKQGQQKSRKRGVFSGAVKDLYSELYSPSKGTIHRRVYESIPAIRNGTLGNRDLTRKLGMGSATTVRQMRTFLVDFEAQYGKAKLMEYLDVIDAIVEAERRPRVGTRVSRRKPKPSTSRADALHRVTVAYLRDPMNWPRPDIEGNPLAAINNQDKRTGTIDDAIANFNDYLPKRR
jgi:DNA invertase Pin-like site-specific DNA recombinase